MRTAIWSRSARRRNSSTLRGVASLEEVERRVKERAQTVPKGTWITGRNWDQSLWPGGEFPTAALLDRGAPGATGVAQTSRRPRRVGELGSDAAGQGGQGFQGTSERADHPRLLAGIRPACSLTVPWGWWAGRYLPAGKDDIKRHLLAAQQAVLEQGLTCGSRRRDLKVGCGCLS